MTALDVVVVELCQVGKVADLTVVEVLGLWVLDLVGTVELEELVLVLVKVVDLVVVVEVIVVDVLMVVVAGAASDMGRLNDATSK